MAHPEIPNILKIKNRIDVDTMLHEFMLLVNIMNNLVLLLALYFCFLISSQLS